MTGSRQSGRRNNRAGRRKTSAKKGTKVPGVLLLTAGIAIGVLITLLSRLLPNVDVSPDVASELQGDIPDGGPATHEPVFDFYTLLPESEVIVPVDQASEKSSVRHAAKAGKGSSKGAASSSHSSQSSQSSQPSQPSSQQGGGFLLQAGSFRSSQDADRLRAQLILSGYDARIEQVTVRGGERWHRVQLGPYNTQKEVTSIRKTLAGMGLDTMLMRQK